MQRGVRQQCIFNTKLTHQGKYHTTGEKVAPSMTQVSLVVSDQRSCDSPVRRPCLKSRYASESLWACLCWNDVQDINMCQHTGARHAYYIHGWSAHGKWFPLKESVLFYYLTNSSKKQSTRARLQASILGFQREHEMALFYGVLHPKHTHELIKRVSTTLLNHAPGAATIFFPWLNSQNWIWTRAKCTYSIHFSPCAQIVRVVPPGVTDKDSPKHSCKIFMDMSTKLSHYIGIIKDRYCFSWLLC